MSASKELSKDYNNHQVGLKGGRSVSKDLHPPGENELKPQRTSDQLNPPNKLGTPGAQPDKGVFSSSED